MVIGIGQGNINLSIISSYNILPFEACNYNEKPWAVEKKKKALHLKRLLPQRLKGRHF